MCLPAAPPGPLPLGEGESSADSLVRRTIAVVHGPNACEQNRKEAFHEPSSGAGILPARFMATIHDLRIIKTFHEPLCGSISVWGSFSPPRRNAGTSRPRPGSWSQCMRKIEKRLPMNRRVFLFERTLPHPSPLPLGEGESSADRLIRRTMAAVQWSQCMRTESKGGCPQSNLYTFFVYRRVNK
jgi:hypothetical protein